MAEPRTPFLLRPRGIFALLALLVLVAVLFTPEPDIGSGSMRLTTFGADAYAARGVHDVMARLGWQVERRRAPLRAPLDTAAVYAILDPPIPVSATEVSALLAAVRSGASALVVPTSGSALADSLGVRQSGAILSQLPVVEHEGHGSEDDAAPAITRAARKLETFDRYLRPVPRSEEDTTPEFPTGAQALVSVRTRARRSTPEEVHPAMMALRVGRGRVLAISDASFLRNGAVREGDAAVLAVRMFEWLDPTRSAPVVFDEYHQGFGQEDSMPIVIRDALLHTAAGRAFLQVAAAGLLLLLVYGVRPIAPTARRTIERRSPLEHVGALSRAYEQIGATRLATRRLVRGLRRRRPMGVASSLDDDAYLALLRARKPQLEADVELVRSALHTPLPAVEWVRVGRAIHNIERTIAQS
jgi:hypothetical protein